MEEKESSQKNNKRVNIAIVVLVLTALGLGIAVYQQNSQKTLPTDKTKEDKEVSVAPSVKRSEEGTSSAAGKPVPTLNLSKLSKEEREVLKISSQSTEEEKKKHFELAQKMAQSADFLGISDCLGKPLVFKVKLGDNFKIKNTDRSDHQFQVNKENLIDIPANSTKTVKADFGNGHGLYGYGCDNGGPSGLMLITE